MTSAIVSLNGKTDSYSISNRLPIRASTCIMVSMISKSTYYSLVRAMTAAQGVIIFKGSKKSCIRMRKNLEKTTPDSYYIAITSKPIGELFIRYV